MLRNWMIVVPLTLGVMGSASAQTVTASGCATQGVTSGCIVLKSGKKTYNISAAKPTPRPGTWGTVKGKVSSDMSMCMQGTLLKPATWRETRRKC